MTTLGPALPRVPTGLAGLDTILQGGFLRGGIYLIQGTPGAGKTILGNQLAFAHVAAGGRAVYVTLLAESHGRMLAHLKAFTFFDPAPLGDALYYVGGYQTLDEGGLPALLALLRDLLRERAASLLVLDGVAAVADAAATASLFKTFIHELQLLGEMLGCTSVLLLPALQTEAVAPAQTMVDGLLALHDRAVGARAVRELEVRKFRGSAYLRGRHAVTITETGLAVYPRTEALLGAAPAEPGEPAGVAPWGIPRLDAMLGGGVPAGSTTLLLGPPGSGKTVLGLHFLATGAWAGEPVLHVGFYEAPARLRATGDRLGLGLSAAVDAGLLTLLWQPPREVLLDALAAQVLETVRRQRVRRLVLDGWGGLQRALDDPARQEPVMAALTNALRAQDVATVLTVDLPAFFGPSAQVPVTGISTLVENIVLLRAVELGSQLYRFLSLLKVRESGYDTAIREVRIGPRGVEVGETFARAEAILSGLGHRLMPGSVPGPQPVPGERGEEGDDADDPGR